MTEYNNSNFNIPSNVLNIVGWMILSITLKSIVVWFGWNLILPTLLNLPIIDFGKAFVLTTVIRVLFSNLNGHSKYHTLHLNDLSAKIERLTNNQTYQNNSILFALAEIYNRDAEEGHKLNLVKAVDNQQ